MFGCCWADVADDEPTLLKHWVDVSCLTFTARGSTLVVKICPRTVRINIFIMAVDPNHRYSNESEAVDPNHRYSNE